MATLKYNLTALDNLLATPTQWTQGCMARDADGRPTLPGSANAACFCLAGGIRRVLKRPDGRYIHRLSEVEQMESAIKQAVHVPELTGFNDTSTFAQVKTAIRYAIEAADLA